MQIKSNQIWLIGGTGESAELARAILAQQLPCIVTVTTVAAKKLYPPESELLQIWVGQLHPEHMTQFLTQYQIGAILDASHPFAVEISQLAIAAATQSQIPYLRYERPEVISETQGIILKDFNSLLTGEFLVGHRVMLTLGYRHLAEFQPWQERATLFVRILPSIVALNAALAAGFTPDRIVAIRPPISPDLELALWQQWQISLGVTKASGEGGGEITKRTIAAKLGIPLIVIQRPDVSYPRQTRDLAVAVQFCWGLLVQSPGHQE